MGQNETLQNHKNRNNLLLVIKKIRELQQANKTETGYESLLDTQAKKTNNFNDEIRIVAPIQRTIAEHLELINNARNILREYLQMKSFILDTYVSQIIRSVGISDETSQEKIRNDIKNEMEENFKNLTNLSARIANEKNSALDKDLTHNELKLLVQDLSCRVEAYKPYYQSYLVDSDENTQILYKC